MNYLKLSTITLCIACLSACSDHADNTLVIDDQEFTGEVNHVAEKLADATKVYALPSPLQTATLLKSFGVPYLPEYLLPPNNNVMANNVSRALNLGMYTIDLGYAAINADSDHAVKYMRTVSNLLKDLGINGADKQKLIEKFEIHADEPDSLSHVILSAYALGHEHFKQDHHEGMGMLIVTGCFIEGLHLALSTYQETQTKVFDRQMIQNEKFAGNIHSLMGFYDHNPQVLKVSNMLVELQEMMQQLNTPEYIGKKVAERPMDYIKSLELLKSKVEYYRGQITE